MQHFRGSIVLLYNVEIVCFRLDAITSQGSDHEQTVAAAVAGAAEARMELKRQEQLVRQLNRQIEQLEVERRPLNEKVKDAESALRTAAKYVLL